MSFESALIEEIEEAKLTREHSANDLSSAAISRIANEIDLDDIICDMTDHLVECFCSAVRNNSSMKELELGRACVGYMTFRIRSLINDNWQQAHAAIDSCYKEQSEINDYEMRTENGR